MEDLRLSEETIRALGNIVGETLHGLRSPQGDESSGWLVVDFPSGALVIAPDSCAVSGEDSRAEYFRLTVQHRHGEPEMPRWPGGPLYEWRALANTPSGAIPAAVVAAIPITGACDLGLGHAGVELTLSSGFRLSVLSEAPGLSPMALQVVWRRQPLRLVPNNSFKPKPLRGSA